MKRSVIVAAINAYMEKTLANTTDKGRHGKVLEVLARDHILVHGIEDVKDCRCRKLGDKDVVTKKGDKYITVEIKCGSGAVTYGEGLTANDIKEENILPKADLVVWFPFPKMAMESKTPLAQGYVMARAEFIDTLTTIGRKGLSSSVKVSSNGNQLNIQTITPKMEEKLWDCLDNFPTVDQYWDKGTH